MLAFFPGERPSTSRSQTAFTTTSRRSTSPTLNATGALTVTSSGTLPVLWSRCSAAAIPTSSFSRPFSDTLITATLCGSWYNAGSCPEHSATPWYATEGGDVLAVHGLDGGGFKQAPAIARRLAAELTNDEETS